MIRVAAAPFPSILVPPVAYRFDAFELHPAERTLLRAGTPIALRTRSFDVLLALVERAGSLVTKADLLEKVWSGLVVEENNIAAQVAALRKVVGSDVIATIPGHGYRFTGDVHAVEGTASPAVALSAPGIGVEAAPPGHLFGRGDDLASVETALRHAGCVSLVGPGGVGKTALARAVVQRWTTSAQWIDLAALSASDQLTGALARALDIASPSAGAVPDAAVVRALSADGLLLVLDNAEHLVDAVATLVRSLQQAISTLKVLVTSQVPLRVDAERVFRVDPLTLPADDVRDGDALATAALAMLVDRVRAADHRFPLGPDAVPQLRRICAKLDGLPLALEMAATRVPLLGLDAVLEGLDQRFALLTRGQRGVASRHKTLRGAIEWSHALLNADEQTLFRRLGAFTEGFSLDMAVALAPDNAVDRWECVDLLAQLVERSLVASVQGHVPRYRLLDTMRSFALESLAASGEEAAVRSRLAQALVDLFRRAKQRPADRALASAAAAELGNAGEVLRWARLHDPGLAIDLTIAASQVATWTPWRGEAGRWVEACEPWLAVVMREVQAQWWTELARHQSFDRGARTVEAARRACELQRALGNDEGLYWALIPQLRSRMLGAEDFDACRDEAQSLLDRHPEWPARLRILLQGSLALEYRRRSDFERALAHQRAELDLARRHAQDLSAESIDNAEVNLAGTLIGLARYDEALALMDELFARRGDAVSPVAAHCRIQQLHALIGLGRLEDAAGVAEQALGLGLRVDAPNVLEALGLLALRQGRPRAAVQWIGRYRGYYRERMSDLPDDAHAAWRHVMASAASLLDADAIARLMDRSAELDADALRALLAVEDIDPAPD